VNIELTAYKFTTGMNCVMVTLSFVMMGQWWRSLGRWQWIDEYSLNRKGLLLNHSWQI